MWNKSHELTDEVVCPYCHAIQADSWEIEPDKEDIGEIDCDECDKPFLAQRIITIEYTTKMIH